MPPLLGSSVWRPSPSPPLSPPNPRPPHLRHTFLSLSVTGAEFPVLPFFLVSPQLPPCTCIFCCLSHRDQCRWDEWILGLRAEVVIAGDSQFLCEFSYPTYCCCWNPANPGRMTLPPFSPSCVPLKCLLLRPRGHLDGNRTVASQSVTKNCSCLHYHLPILLGDLLLATLFVLCLPM